MSNSTQTSTHPPGGLPHIIAQQNRDRLVLGTKVKCKNMEGKSTCGYVSVTSHPHPLANLVNKTCPHPRKTAQQRAHNLNMFVHVLAILNIPGVGGGNGRGVTS